MATLPQIFFDLGLEKPDGRPLHALPLTPELHANLAQILRFRVASGQPIESTAAIFVLWASEYIRARFGGGQLTWEFIFQGLNLSEDQTLARNLVERGLRFWGRQVRESEQGIHMYLYTLMAEGGLPETLLKEPGLYQRVVKGLLRDVEAEGPEIPEAFTFRVADRWVKVLPQTFQSDDIVRLLADLALSLVRLRAETPADVPIELVDRWLDKHRPDWARDLPLRMSKEAADSLIRPALRTERKTLVTSGPLARRALFYDEASESWHAFIKVAEGGALSKRLLPEAEGLRLRLLPAGSVAARAGSLVYGATPGEGGWSLRRIGGSSAVNISLKLDEPFVLSAVADGRLKGEVEIVPALPAPDEAPSLWRAAEPAAGSEARELVPIAGSGRTRAQHVWLLTANEARPKPGDGLLLTGPQLATAGRLWRISGSGILRVGDQSWSIKTGADEEAPETQLVIHGEPLKGWKLKGSGGYVLLGTPDFFGQSGMGGLLPLRAERLRIRPGRLLMSRIAEWVNGNEVLARARFVALPEGTELTLRETGPVSLVLKAKSLPSRLLGRLSAGGKAVGTEFSEGAAEMAISVPGAPPGEVTLRLSDPAAGASLELISAWPARQGIILTPDGNRLERDTSLAVDALHGWRAVIPEGETGDLQFRLAGERPVALRVAAEVPLAAHAPLIRSMLAQAGPDAQVNVRIITGGTQSPRLEIRRYDRQAIVQNDSLRLGLPRDEPVGEETVFTRVLMRGTVRLHAVDVSLPEKQVCREIELAGSVDLRSVLPEWSGSWLIQATFKGHVQRPVVWTRNQTSHSTREERISTYVSDWEALTQAPEHPDWDRLWSLIRAASEGGDAGALDQVQALAYVPEAAAILLLRVPLDELNDAFTLDLAAPIFWPTLTVEAVGKALLAERRRLVARYSRVLDPAEAEQDTHATLARRIAAVLTLNPELAGHFGAALIEEGLVRLISDHQEALSGVVVADPVDRLVTLAHEAARRFDRLPSGMQGLEPHNRPSGLSFNRYLQPVIDSPFVAAEIAAGVRTAPDTSGMLALINLRLVDHLYFDCALPAALTLARQQANR